MHIIRLKHYPSTRVKVKDRSQKGTVELSARGKNTLATDNIKCDFLAVKQLNKREIL